MASKKDKGAEKPASDKPKKAKAAVAPAAAPVAAPPAPVRTSKRQVARTGSGPGNDAPPPAGGWADARIVAKSRGADVLQVEVLNGVQVESTQSLIEFFAPTGKGAPPVNGQFRVTLSLSNDPAKRARQVRDLNAMLDTFLRLWGIESGIVARCESTPSNPCQPNSNVAPPKAKRKGKSG